MHFKKDRSPAILVPANLSVIYIPASASRVATSHSEIHISAYLTHAEGLVCVCVSFDYKLRADSLAVPVWLINGCKKQGQSHTQLKAVVLMCGFTVSDYFSSEEAHDFMMSAELYAVKQPVERRENGVER